MWLTGLVAPRHVGSSQTRARTHVPCIGRQTLNHCATREAPSLLIFKTFLEIFALCLFHTLFKSFLIPPILKIVHKVNSNLAFFVLNKFILFIYFWLHRVFVAACGLSLVAASGGYSSLRCAGFSLRWLLLLRSMGSRYMGFSSCGTWAQ